MKHLIFNIGLCLLALSSSAYAVMKGASSAQSQGALMQYNNLSDVVDKNAALTNLGAITAVTAGTGLTGGGNTGMIVLNSGVVQTMAFQPGLLTSIITTKAGFIKFSKTSTIDGLSGSALLYTCVSSPTITIYECGTSTTCATPTTIGSVNVTSSGVVYDGVINSSNVNAGDYVAFSLSGTCVAVNLSATVQYHTN